MHATTIRQQTTAQAMSVKLSVMARVNACCRTCRPRISAALPVALSGPADLDVMAALMPSRRCLVAAFPSWTPKTQNVGVELLAHRDEMLDECGSCLAAEETNVWK